MRWSKNIEGAAPKLIDAEDFDVNTRAYPYHSTDEEESFVKVTARSVTFTGQTGPIKERGVNGCQIDDLLTFALGTLQTFNKKYSCRENSLAITKLEECLHWLEARTRDREVRGTEGLNRT